MMTLAIIITKMFGDEFDNESLNREGFGFYVFALSVDFLNYTVINAIVEAVL